jgi:hypothetical protein
VDLEGEKKKTRINKIKNKTKKILVAKINV